MLLNLLDNIQIKGNRKYFTDIDDKVTYHRKIDTINIIMRVLIVVSVLGLSFFLIYKMN